MAFTQIEAAGITSTSTVVLQNATVTGVLTATSGFVGNLTGSVTGSVIGAVSGNVTGNTTGSHIGNVTAGSITINSSNNTISGVTTAGITTVYISAINDGPISGTRNRIINGDMRIDQRNAGSANTSPSDFSVDRWIHAYGSTNSTASIQRVSDAPVGFTSSLRYTVTSAAFPLANSSSISQRIEGFNVSDFKWGTSNASPITLSFWVKSSLTGNFGGSITNVNFDRTYPFPYTISSSNTWEYKTITIPGDTTGTWNTDNTTGIQLNFSLGAVSAREATTNVWANTIARQPTGSMNLISTNGATFQLTGVQLEAGTVATPFERRSYGQEIALCQRYYIRYSAEGGAYGCLSPSCIYSQAINGVAAFSLPVQMRIQPSCGFSGSNTIQFSSGTVGYLITAVANLTSQSTTKVAMVSATTSGLPQVALRLEAAANGSAYVDFTAEL